VSYVASVSRLATAAGHGRDTKAIALLVEPYLLQRGLLDVLPTGRALTPAGVERARQLTGA
jgi:Holliday junction resolvasome RuvABC ATP-dependent DNA helicase subunit